MSERYTRSQELFAAAQQVIPGGVNSPVRAFRGVGGTPIFFASGAGPWLTDVDGNRYLDYVLSWGPLLLGHAHPVVVKAIAMQAAHGTSFGAPTKQETELAEEVIKLMPGIEQVRFVNSGTEATMSALRLARAYTGREKLLKFTGCYHGHADMLLVQAGSGVVTLGLPDSPGVTAGAAANTLTAEYNDLEAATAIFREQGNAIAAIIVEPIAANMGFVLPEPGYLEGLIELAHSYGALLILDEVMTGFRVAPGGAQGLWGLKPDLTCLGKVIGGGLPVGAYAGRREIMQQVAPAGPMYQAGTLSGNPLAMAAGLATLQTAFGTHGDEQASPFAQAEERARALADGMRKIGEELDVPLQVGQVGTMFGFYFLKEPGLHVRSYADAKQMVDPARYASFFWAMCERGVYLAPSQFEAGFISAAHTDEDVARTLDAAREVLKG
ncbi:glutamate-1-semialdehyde 2,1-aminomutase [Candidatus Chloroploca sp. M-50]|uniref:Glutamate-1-semialdehyde 2,1-aminomutase n=1 Tax=Candidatus Chloroploca mongolica TaxID=2528176 RepID=A0ABS4DEC6_9CHLR|nr:glutamate-1-semialdehyde 2,1-aminomutase [Candidatus Chloroploca mongolica]MBP1467787.1 glutamate-1-semialdehyde 2,1-aminomutase [Candidatus Chloroploca mongolica]